MLLSDPIVNFLLYGGAIRGAKTIWLGITFAELAKLYPNSRWAIMRADRPKITNNLLPSISWLYSEPGIKEYIVKSNKADYTFHFWNGSVVQLFPESFNSDKDMSRFHGLEVNGFGLDELSEFQKQTLEKCFERAGAWLNAKPSIFGKEPRPLVLASCNPTKNWVKELIYDPYIAGTLQPEWRYVQAKVSDNPYVKESYKTNLKKNMTYANYQRFVDGDWEYVEPLGHEWLFNFSYTQHVKSVSYIKDLPTYLTFDFNVWPYMTMLCFQVVPVQETGGFQVRIYDEFCLAHPKNTVKEVCQAWIKEYPEVHGSVPVNYCGDASGENQIPGFGDVRAFNAVRTTLAKYLHGSSNRVYKKGFFNEFLRPFINDCLSGFLPIEIIIDEKKCPNLIKDVQETLESPTGGFFKEKVKDPKTGITYEKNGHCVDALKYGVLSVFSHVYEDKYHKKNY